MTKSNGTALPEPVAARLRIPIGEERADVAGGVRDDFQQGPKAAPRRADKKRKPRLVESEVVSAAALQPPANAALCLVVSPDGEYPKLEVFSGIEGLTSRLRELEGEDVTVFPFYGVPLPFTRGPHRFLYLPNGQPFPVFDLSPFGKFVPNPTGQTPTDPSYYLGPDDLREAVPETAIVDHRKPDPATDKDGDQPLRPDAAARAAEEVDSSEGTIRARMAGATSG